MERRITKNLGPEKPYKHDVINFILIKVRHWSFNETTFILQDLLEGRNKKSKQSEGTFACQNFHAPCAAGDSNSNNLQIRASSKGPVIVKSDYYTVPQGLLHPGAKRRKVPKYHHHRYRNVKKVPTVKAGSLFLSALINSMLV